MDIEDNGYSATWQSGSLVLRDITDPIILTNLVNLYMGQFLQVQILFNYAHHLGNCVSIIFLILGSSLAHLEPKLQLFEVDDHDNAGNDDLSHHHLPNFKQL